ncbi:MAG TPA: hypothetical protein VER77_04590, partial [Candidatus Dormibacteraeota bacterium]|nr:hypothetical protein [Candidatus Dormibacteraeota bacterium]
EEVPNLLRIKVALALGHRPAEVFRLQPSAIDALVAMRAVSIGLPPPPAPPRPAPPAHRSTSSDVEGPPHRLLESVRSFDRADLERELRARWAELGPVGFLGEAASPFMEALGKECREGRLEVRHEHFASSLLAGLLRELRRPYDDRASGRWVAATTFPGDRHELGLLMASLLCAVRGWRVLYIGVDTPVEQTAALSREAPLSAVVLSISATVPQAYAFALTLDLRRMLPQRIAIWVGGRGASAVAAGVQPFDDFEILDRHLAAVANGAALL